VNKYVCYFLGNG